MPHTNRRGFSETDLMKQAGHCLWQAISSALGQPLSALRTVGGGEVYAAFYYIETVVPEVASLETYQVDDTVKFTISLRAFKNLSIEARVRVHHAGSSIAALRATADKKDPAPHAADGLDIRFANIFITPLAGNNALKVAPPAGVDCAALPPLRWTNIPPHNLVEVVNATVALIDNPAIDIDIIQRGMGSKNDPMFVAYRYDAPLSSKAVIDACRPWEHLHEFPAVAEASKDLQEKTRAKWKDLLG